MIPNVNIRSAVIENVKLLASIIRASHMDVAEKFKLNIENCPKHPSNCSVDWIKKDIEKGVAYYIFEYSGLPKGCVALEQADSGTCYIERLSVLREYRHYGFGEKLMHHAIDCARDLGVKQVSIGTIAEFTLLNDWYQKLGFVPGEVKKFDHLPFDVQLMEYKL